MFRLGLNNDRRRPQNNDAGFSLIEIAVVLMIIAIVSAFVIPQIVSYLRMYRLGVGGRDVATALQRARYLATSSNTLAGVAFNEPQHVDVEQYDPEGKLPAQNRGAVQLPEGVTVDTDAPRQIAFDGRGVIAPMPREAPSIRINGADGYYLFVVVSPTGQVTVSEPQKDRI
jgi:prepilin-type N-terminal cleavage/methylation domain-containing protein